MDDPLGAGQNVFHKLGHFIIEAPKCSPTSSCAFEASDQLPTSQIPGYICTGTSLIPHPLSLYIAYLASLGASFGLMVSTAYPYPVNETTRRAPMRPYIYSPSSESHCSPKRIMYPHQSPSPNYFYAGYDQYYSKNSWASAASWPSFYPLPESTVNAKVTILPPKPILVSDMDTPSSASSHSLLTPSSPVDASMDFDEFDYDDDEDYLTDFTDDMDTEPAPSYTHTKSTSALEGALGDLPADRRLSASVPYPSTRATHHRQSSSPVYIQSTSHRLPILQPQPIRPIPPIPIAELASLDVLPLLCQPVSDAIRYQLGGVDREPTPSDLPHGTVCQAQTDGTCSVGKTVFPCGCVGWR